MTPEGRIKAKLNRLLKRYEPKVWRFMPVQRGYGMQALDYLLCVNGKFVAVETKRPGGKLTNNQRLCAERILLAGGSVFVVDSEASMEAFIQYVDELCRT